MSTTKERISKYLEFKGISKRDFYNKIGVSNGFLDSGKEIGSDKVEIIMDTFPYLNIMWMLTGKGDMEMSERVALNIKKLTEQSDGAINGAIDGAIKKNNAPIENFPSDGNPGCKNCQKLEQDVFFLRDVIKSNNLSISSLSDENGRLKAENAELRAENEQLKGKPGTNNKQARSA